MSRLGKFDKSKFQIKTCESENIKIRNPVMRRYIILGITLLLSMSLTHCTTEGSTGESTTVVPAAVPVKTMKLLPQSFSNYLSVTGTVEARNHIRIMVEEPGTLSRILKDKGRYTNAGEVLAVLENKVLAASFEQAKAALQQAELDHKSKSVLFEKRAISENEYLNAKYNLQAARAAFNLTKARFDKLSITAPIGGLINERYYDLGAYVNPMTPIFELIDNEMMKIRAGVAERFLSEINVGTPVTITFDAYPDLTYNAEIGFVSRSIDPKSRTFIVEIIVPNKDRKLAPAMVANLHILRESHADQIVVPLDALMESEKGWYVFIREGDTAKKIFVRQEAIYGDEVMISGVAPGAELIYVGQRDLSDGDTIIVVN